MEMDFKKMTIPGYRMPMCQVQTKEQTQDLRIPDSEGDIGSILGCWGQILLRSKEWHGDGIGVSGGVMAWILYAPEDGGAPVRVETWIPFQMKWDMHDVQNDGSLLVLPLLKSIDARNVSARKMVVRANVSILAQAMEPVESQVYQAEHLPEDICLLKQNYPLEIPNEAGEMAFQTDEDVNLPEGNQAVHKMIYYSLEPVITESRILSDKLLFRGKLKLHMLYMSEDGSVHGWDSETGFSKYTQLGKDHASGCTVRMVPVLTGAEVDLQENRLQLKVSLAAQYIIYDRVMLEMVSDAYSPIRDLITEKERMNITTRLDAIEKDIQMEQASQFSAQRILDVSCLYGHPSARQNGDVLECELNSCFQILCTDENGLLQGHTVRTDSQFEIPTDSDNSLCLYPNRPLTPEIYPDGENMYIKASMNLNCDTLCGNGIEMVSALNIGEAHEPDPTRPSIILRKVADEQLWDLAKSCGSSVNAIQEANSLQGEPQPGQILLIPVQ